MKNLTAAALIAASATTAFAGAHDPKGEVMMEPVVVVEEAAQSSSGAGLIIPLLLLVIVAAAASSTSGGTSDQLLQVSDERLKTDIIPIGSTSHGLTLYNYRYIWSDKIVTGVMAQEVLMKMPEAVALGADGYYRVNYGMLGLVAPAVD